LGLQKGICSEAPCGAAEQNPVEQKTGGTPLIGEEHLSIGSQTPENLEGLTEKVGTLGLQARKKNRCGAARKRARKARLAEAPNGDSSGGRPRSALADQPNTQQEPRTSGALQRSGPAPAKRTPPESGGGQMTGPSKRQRSAGGTPEDGHAKRPKQTGQPSYTRVSREGHRIAIVCEDYPKTQVSREHFVDIQRAIGHAFPLHFFNIIFHIILPSMVRSSQQSLCLRLPHQNSVCIYLLPIQATSPANLILHLIA